MCMPGFIENRPKEIKRFILDDVKSRLFFSSLVSPFSCSTLYFFIAWSDLLEMRNQLAFGYVLHGFHIFSHINIF